MTPDGIEAAYLLAITEFAAALDRLSAEDGSVPTPVRERLAATQRAIETFRQLEQEAVARAQDAKTAQTKWPRRQSQAQVEKYRRLAETIAVHRQDLEREGQGVRLSTTRAALSEEATSGRACRNCGAKFDDVTAPFTCTWCGTAHCPFCAAMSPEFCQHLLAVETETLIGGFKLSPFPEPMPSWSRRLDWISHTSRKPLFEDLEVDPSAIASAYISGFSEEPYGPDLFRLIAGQLSR